ncbi:hypothetical protein MNB_SV-4-1117 [hydrothermal vent metagenome]|uniref:Microcin J25-processing protein McjB C-terminal domain-containing protein n=1 Tax=hydrothermal vent metagenome TaxID=652676 RepID=A0A1W1E8P2_9ZZZZ
MAVVKKIGRFFALSFKEKRLFFEAYWTLGLMRLYILVRPFKHISAPLMQYASQEEASVCCADPYLEKEARSIGRAIVRAAAYTPWQSACLAQSLTAWKMLQKRSIDGYFVLGAKKENAHDGTLAAHAWSKCGNTFLTGKEGHENFTPISVFGWNKKLSKETL